MDWLKGVVDSIAELSKFWELFLKLCRDYPALTTLLLTPLLFALGFAVAKQHKEIVNYVKLKGKTKKGRIKLLSIVLVSCLLSFLIVSIAGITGRQKPILSTFYGSVDIIGKPLVLCWVIYNQDSANIVYTVQASADPLFHKCFLNETTPLQHYQLIRPINGISFWRVRAEQFGHKSPWSNTLHVESYSNVIERNIRRGKVEMYTSNSIDQSFFKISTGQDSLTGFDIELARLIVKRLSRKLGLNNTLDLDIKLVPFADLFELPAMGTADFIISSLTFTKEREKQYDIAFTNPYFASSISIVYKADSQVSRSEILGKLPGSTVAVQNKSIGKDAADLINQSMRGSDSLKVIDSYMQITDAINEFEKDSKIDYIITDTEWAKEAVIKRRAAGSKYLQYLELTKTDFPDVEVSFNNEYAIAVHSSQTELLVLLNNILSELNREGEVDSLLGISQFEFTKRLTL